jgi:transposase InsO family protein
MISGRTKVLEFEEKLAKIGIIHKLIKPATLWHNGKVERSHRMDQRYFYEWESFRNIDEFNNKLKEHLEWTNTKPMRIFKGKSPTQKLEEYMWVI